ncbi:rod-binding protein [Bombella sp. ESL0380]|uniref:rod-binding protein n=1 Tax=Bombella sp. ESL0380 TaxID=2676444 RepID=UPI002FDA4380
MSISSVSHAAFAHVAAPSAGKQADRSHPMSPQDENRVRKTARDFEAMALGEMLQPMFDTVDNSAAPFGGGNAEKQFRSMQVLELGKEVARSGGIGIAHQVYGRMKAMQEQAAQASSIHPSNRTGGYRP